MVRKFTDKIILRDIFGSDFESGYSVGLNLLLTLRKEGFVKNVLDDLGILENHVVWVMIGLELKSRGEKDDSKEGSL